jgi:hypothetical protein
MALGLALSLAGDATARKFQMSGSWISRNGVGFIPLQFAVAGMDMTGIFIHASMGNLTEALGHPNGPILGQGGVTATGSAPATLRIPPHRFVEDAMTLLPQSGVTLVQFTTNVGIDAPYAAATLAPGGGPGSFTWCPRDPACVAGGGMLSTDPPPGTSVSFRRNGRVIYRSGASHFGGSMQLGLRRGASVSLVFDTSPFRAAHLQLWGRGTTLRPQAPGGLGSPDAPVTVRQYLTRGFVTQPTMVPPMGSPILYPGPKVTTMYGTTLLGSGPVFYLPQIATGPMGTAAGQFTTEYGFAHTTGTVIVQQVGGSSGQDFFTVMGSDARTPLGAGNLSLVAGGLSFHNSLSGTDFAARFHKVKLTLAPPIPSLSPAGVAVAAALLLLAAGYALHGRSRGAH